jgi:hypothetical protein
MKIAKDRLKQIIREELEIGHAEGGERPKDPDGYEGRMFKQNLFKIKEYAEKMSEFIGDSDNMEPWVEEKIAVAAYIMDSVGHYLEYEHMRGDGGEESEEHGGEEEEFLEPEEGEEEYEMDGEDEELDEGAPRWYEGPDQELNMSQIQQFLRGQFSGSEMAEALSWLQEKMQEAGKNTLTAREIMDALGLDIGAYDDLDEFEE